MPEPYAAAPDVRSMRTDDPLHLRAIRPQRYQSAPIALPIAAGVRIVKEEGREGQRKGYC